MAKNTAKNPTPVEPTLDMPAAEPTVEPTLDTPPVEPEFVLVKTVYGPMVDQESHERIPHGRATSVPNTRWLRSQRDAGKVEFV